MAEANWDLFRLFFAVARTGSVNRAAQDLGMSQPTLSRRLKELERYVGAPLFFRASSGVKLTQEGEDLRRSASDMMLARSALTCRSEIVDCQNIGDRRLDQALAPSSRKETA